MKFSLSILFLFALLKCYSQDINEVDSIKIYLRNWNAMHKYTYIYHYYFETPPVYINQMFIDYEDFINKVGAKSTITITPTSPIVKNKVVFKFVYGDIAEVYFNNYGEYKFEGKWHKMNDDFYYLLFQYFSDKMIPEKILIKAEENYKGGVWSDE